MLQDDIQALPTADALETFVDVAIEEDPLLIGDVLPRTIMQAGRIHDDAIEIEEDRLGLRAVQEGGRERGGQRLATQLHFLAIKFHSNLFARQQAQAHLVALDADLDRAVPVNKLEPVGVPAGSTLGFCEYKLFPAMQTPPTPL